MAKMADASLNDTNKVTPLSQLKVLKAFLQPVAAPRSAQPAPVPESSIPFSWHPPGKTQKSSKKSSAPPPGVPPSFRQSQDRAQYHDHPAAYPRAPPRDSSRISQPHAPQPIPNISPVKKRSSSYIENISISDFSCRAVLGRGHFGKVKIKNIILISSNFKKMFKMSSFYI